MQAALCAGLLWASAAHAAEPGTESDPVGLEAFHVMGHRVLAPEDTLPLSVSYIDNADLKRRTQATLGETLGWEPGVQSTFFGPGSSRPAIRGHDGKRVRVLNHGVGTGDDSDQSPDHAVAIDPLLIDSVVVLRGPAALSYGGGAIGGAVDIRTRMIPHDLPGKPVSLEVETQYNSGNAEKTGYGSATVQMNPQWAARVNLVHRNADDLRIPGAARSRYFDEVYGGPGPHEDDHDHDHDHDDHAHDDHHDHDPNGHDEGPVGLLSGSAYRNTHFGFGVARITADSSMGISYARFDSRYGVPFHVHGEHDDHDDDDHSEDHDHHDDHDEDHDHHDDNHQDEQHDHDEHDPEVEIALRQNRFDWEGEWRNPMGGFSLFSLRASYTDYEHTEWEGEHVGTVFTRETWEARGKAVHEPIGNASGALGFQLARRDYRADGEEAFTPANRSQYRALFYLNEWDAEPVTFQTGLRYENQRIRLRDGSSLRRSDDAVAASFGIVRSLNRNWRLHLGLSFVERVPSPVELYADGPHAATQTYEVGNPDIERERSRGLEAKIEHTRGAVSGSLTAYFQRFGSYTFMNPTGHIRHGFREFTYVQRETVFYGGELDLRWNLREGPDGRSTIRFMSDWVRATDRSTDQPIPRIPPMRLALRFEERYAQLSWGIEVRHSRSQDRVHSEFEAPTAAYTFLNADIEYRPQLDREDQHLTLFIRGTNLTDEEARNHISVLKEAVPMPGRSFRVGLRWEL